MKERKRGSRFPRLSLVVLGVLAVAIPMLVAATLVGNLAPALRPVGAGQGGAVTPAKQTTSEATSAVASSNSSAACAGPTAYAGLDSTSPASSNFSKSFGIFSMPDGTTGMLCITFSDTNALVASTVKLNETVSIGNLHALTFTNGTTKHIFEKAAAVTVTPAQPELILGGPGGPTKATIAFTIATSANSTGFYFLNVGSLSPVACEDDFRFAVGYAFVGSNATGSYFPLPPNFGSCTPAAPKLFAQVYGVKDMQVTYLSCGSFTCDDSEPSQG